MQLEISRTDTRVQASNFVVCANEYTIRCHAHKHTPTRSQNTLTGISASCTSHVRAFMCVCVHFQCSRVTHTIVINKPDHIYAHAHTRTHPAENKPMFGARGARNNNPNTEQSHCSPPVCFCVRRVGVCCHLINVRAHTEKPWRTSAI